MSKTDDEAYYRWRADAEARMAEAASDPQVRLIHQRLRMACLSRVVTAVRDARTIV